MNANIFFFFVGALFLLALALQAAWWLLEHWACSWVIEEALRQKAGDDPREAPWYVSLYSDLNGRRRGE